MKEALYIMIGGFLGAGKSTSVGRLARRLTDAGKKVGLITNDQGSHLVDTSALRSQGFRVEEIAGGCFCCRFSSLRAAAESLGAESRPDVFIAEPVGSCTDLVATVSYPLRRIYGDGFRIAPLSVLVDPARALRVLGIEDGKKFSRNVSYVYRKQLEEADYIISNKRDLVDGRRRARLREALEREYPRADVLEVSARTGEGLDAWFERLLSGELPEGKELEIDYDIYADGEARLGWLNATVALGGSPAVDGNRFLLELASRLGRRLSRAGAEIAHLKLTLEPLPADGKGEGPPLPLAREIAVVNLVGLEREPEISHVLSQPVEGAEIVLNLRAEAEPDVLRAALEEELGVRGPPALELRHVECFRPGRPEPEIRIGCGSATSGSAGDAPRGEPMKKRR